MLLEEVKTGIKEEPKIKEQEKKISPEHFSSSEWTKKGGLINLIIASLFIFSMLTDISGWIKFFLGFLSINYFLFHISLIKFIRGAGIPNYSILKKNKKKYMIKMLKKTTGRISVILGFCSLYYITPTYVSGADAILFFNTLITIGFIYSIIKTHKNNKKEVKEFKKIRLEQREKDREEEDLYSIQYYEKD